MKTMQMETFVNFVILKHRQHLYHGDAERNDEHKDKQEKK